MTAKNTVTVQMAEVIYKAAALNDPTAASRDNNGMTFGGRLASSARAAARRGLLEIIAERVDGAGRKIVIVELTDRGLDLAIELDERFTSTLDLIKNYA